MFHSATCSQVSASLASHVPVGLSEVAEVLRLSSLQENLLDRTEQLVMTSGLPVMGRIQLLAERHHLLLGGVCWK